MLGVYVCVLFWEIEIWHFLFEHKAVEYFPKNNVPNTETKHVISSNAKAMLYIYKGGIRTSQIFASV